MHTKFCEKPTSGLDLDCEKEWKIIDMQIDNNGPVTFTSANPKEKKSASPSISDKRQINSLRLVNYLKIWTYKLTRMGQLHFIIQDNVIL